MSVVYLLDKADYSGSTNQCLLSVDGTCQTTLDNTNNYEWHTFKLNRFGRTAKSFSVRKSDGQCLCKDYSWNECTTDNKVNHGIYSLKHSGGCNRYITTVKECQEAARYLNLADQIIDPGTNHNNINHNGLEYGCILQKEKAVGDLYINLNTANRGNCAKSKYACICAENDESLRIDSYDIVPEVKLPMLHRHCEDCDDDFKDLYYVREHPFRIP